MEPTLLNAEEKGALIRQLRESKEMNQTALGNLSGWGQSAISKLEKGQIQESSSTKMYKLAQALDTTVEYIETGLAKYQIEQTASSLAVREITANYKALPDEIHIYHLAASASMGGGICAQQAHDQVIGLITASKQWANKHLQNASNPNNVFIITGRGDSMEPTFKDGAPLFVDTGINNIHSDGIYVFEYDNELYIKRLSRQLGELMVLSDNPKYQAFSLPKDKLEQTRIIGRIIGTCPFVEI